MSINSTVDNAFLQPIDRDGYYVMSVLYLHVACVCVAQFNDLVVLYTRVVCPG